jgi:hypothetical protein
MQQRQLRLGDILDDYCPRERRLTNHAVVAMVGPDVKQTRCTTCDTEHEYKHAKVPRQRRKADRPAALSAQALAGGPKRVIHDVRRPDGDTDTDDSNNNRNVSDTPIDNVAESQSAESHVEELVVEGEQLRPAAEDEDPDSDAVVVVDEAPESDDEDGDDQEREKGPVHRPLIRASLPRPEGQPPQTRPGPDFTIRQPGGRPSSRFRPRHQRGGQQFQGNRSNGNPSGGPMRSGAPRQGGRPPASSRLTKRHSPGRKRSK